MAFRSHIPRTSTMSPVDVAVVDKACTSTPFFQMQSLADLLHKSCNGDTVGIGVVDCPFSSSPGSELHTHTCAFVSHILHTTKVFLWCCSLCSLWHPARIAQFPSFVDIRDNADKLYIAYELAAGSSRHFLEIPHLVCTPCKLCTRCWVR